MESHLLQMRGLKRDNTPMITNQKSHLLQMRGLKPDRIDKECLRACRIFYRCVD